MNVTSEERQGLKRLIDQAVRASVKLPEKRQRQNQTDKDGWRLPEFEGVPYNGIPIGIRFTGPPFYNPCPPLVRPAAWRISIFKRVYR